MSIFVVMHKITELSKPCFVYAISYSFTLHKFCSLRYCLKKAYVSRDVTEFTLVSLAPPAALEVEH